jgi:hypothetical protein
VHSSPDAHLAFKAAAWHDGLDALHCRLLISGKFITAIVIRRKTCFHIENTHPDNWDDRAGGGMDPAGKGHSTPSFAPWCHPECPRMAAAASYLELIRGTLT